jgi:hypothetical protein
MVWGGGFLGELGVLDYAGGTGVGNREALRGEFLPQSLGKSSQNAPSKLQDGRQNKIERRSVAPVGAYTQNQTKCRGRLQPAGNLENVSGPLTTQVCHRWTVSPLCKIV